LKIHFIYELKNITISFSVIPNIGFGFQLQNACVVYSFSFSLKNKKKKKRKSSTDLCSNGDNDVHHDVLVY